VETITGQFYVTKDTNMNSFFCLAFSCIFNKSGISPGFINDNPGEIHCCLAKTATQIPKITEAPKTTPDNELNAICTSYKSSSENT
jgi:hypothetical protein